MIKVLFVCLGNICRSPSGEGIFTSIVEDRGYSNKIEIDSAGTSAYHVGEPADSRMQKYANKRGYKLLSRSRQFKYQDFENFDYIIAMDSSNYEDITRMDRDNIYKSKVKMMTDFSEDYIYQDVPDPYYGGPEGFNNVITILEDSCNGFLEFLIKNEKL